MQILSKELNKRFCKDCNIPINLFDDPYFSDRLMLCHNMYDSIEKYNLFVNTVNNYESQGKDYFEEYISLKEKIMEHIKSKEAFQYFNNVEDMNKFRTQNKIQNTELYSNNNVGKIFISIDMTSANFNALRHYSNSIVDDMKTWEDFIGQFTNDEYIKQSKYIRQVIFGNCNPKRQITYQQYLMDLLLTKLFTIINKQEVLKLSSDEIILNDISKDIFDIIMLIVNSFEVPLHIERFRLSKIVDTTEDNIIGYYKDMLDPNIPWFKNQIKCVSDLYMPSVLRFINGEQASHNDLYFKHEHRLAKLINPLKLGIIGEISK